MIADQTTDYYPFGLTFRNTNTNVNRYLFSGKEFQDQTVNGSRLMLYDFGARNYDPILGRWFNIDPALQFTNPYIYCANNPMRFIDPDGKTIQASYSADGRPKYFNWEKGDGHWTLYSSETDKEGNIRVPYKFGAEPKMDLKSKNGKGGDKVDINWEDINTLNDILSKTSAAAGALGEYVEGRELKNSEGTLENGTKGNPKVTTRSVPSIGKKIQRVGKVTGYVSIFISAVQLTQATTIEEGCEHGLDVLMGGLAYVPPFGTAVSLFWSFGGKELHYQWVDTQMELGTIGLPAVQPFK